MKTLRNAFLITMLLVFSATISRAHCEIPCGIYHDHLRIDLIKEHIQTIEKSMKMIEELQQAENIDYNQLVRWIDNKEAHANKLQEIVTQYFMTQRIKPVDPSDTEKYDKYIKEITLLHELLIYSMKAKQSTDMDVIDKLTQKTEAFAESYFSDKEHDHSHDHKH